MNKQLVVPKAGYKINDPERHDFLPPGGREIDLDGAYLQHWARRIADGDVTIVEDTDNSKTTKTRITRNQNLSEG
jgi:hypothetical protein